MHYNLYHVLTASTLQEVTSLDTYEMMSLKRRMLETGEFHSCDILCLVMILQGNCKICILKVTRWADLFSVNQHYEHVDVNMWLLSKSKCLPLFSAVVACWRTCFSTGQACAEAEPCSMWNHETWVDPKSCPSRYHNLSIHTANPSSELFRKHAKKCAKGIILVASTNIMYLLSICIYIWRWFRPHRVTYSKGALPWDFRMSLMQLGEAHRLKNGDRRFSSLLGMASRNVSAG